MHAHIPENHWQCECSKSDDPEQMPEHITRVFPESLCERGFRETTSVQENVVLANIRPWTCACVDACILTLSHSHTHTSIHTNYCENYQTLSRGNSYVFYEVANLYEFV